MKNTGSVRPLCIAALGAVINVVCPFFSMTLRLPIFMDSIGTVLVASLLGPKYGILAGLSGSLLSGLTFDVYSLYYAPVQIFTACMASWIMRGHWGHSWRMLAGGIAVSLPTALASAMITAWVFGGLTSSNTSFLVMWMQHHGFSLTLSCFVVQILFEYLDKLTAMALTRLALNKGGKRIYGTLQ